MKKFIILFILTLNILHYALIGQEFSVSQLLNLRNEYGATLNNILTFGVDPRGTDGIDTILSEFDIPNMPPMSQLHGLFKLPVSPVSLSYIDIRPPSNTRHFIVQYELITQRGGDSLYFSWPPLKEGMDSAVITDQLDGAFFYINMKNKLSAKVENPYVDAFYIKAYFTNPAVDVFEYKDISKDDIILYPNPAVDKITLNTGMEYFNFKIFDMLGEDLITGQSDISQKVVSLASLQPGTYYFQIINHDGTIYFRKFVKI
jgi:hypothetical protein